VIRSFSAHQLPSRISFPPPLLCFFSLSFLRSRPSVFPHFPFASVSLPDSPALQTLSHPKASGRCTTRQLPSPPHGSSDAAVVSFFFYISIACAAPLATCHPFCCRVPGWPHRYPSTPSNAGEAFYFIYISWTYQEFFSHTGWWKTF